MKTDDGGNLGGTNMADTTHISWADATFNFWIGCTKVVPGCDNCYAEHLMDARFGRVTWGPGEDRVLTSAANRRKPLAWDRAAAKAGTRPCVFCSSLSDVFDSEVDPIWRRTLFATIHATPNLVWLLLTKRIGNVMKMVGTLDDRLDWPRNAALGATVVNQEEADRDIPKLLAAAEALNPLFTFLSVEPMLGPVDLTRIDLGATGSAYAWYNALNGRFDIAGRLDHVPRPIPKAMKPVDWVIVGGETSQGAHEARPMHPDWVRGLRDQCALAGVPFHFKQWGSWLPWQPAWQPDQAPEWKSQAGFFIDSHKLPDFSRGRLRGWSDDCFYDGEDICVHEHVGPRAAGRMLDGVIHDARPKVLRHHG
jgi:protein gp37